MLMSLPSRIPSLNWPAACRCGTGLRDGFHRLIGRARRPSRKGLIPGRSALWHSPVTALLGPPVTRARARSLMPWQRSPHTSHLNLHQWQLRLRS